MIIKSFNWSELIIIIESKNAEILANVLLRIRKLAVHMLGDSSLDICKNSLYHSLGVSKIENAHLFSESLSYFGVCFDNINKIDGETKLNTHIEWQVKPGHLSYFSNEISKATIDVGENYENLLIKDGKTDYLLINQRNSKVLSQNKELFNALRNNDELRKHIRKVKTKVLFEITDENKTFLKELKEQHNENPCNIEGILSKFRIDQNKNVSQYLRKLNVSRITRKKVTKLIYNYNLGIQDAILSLYFIDFHNIILLFMKELELLSNNIETALVAGKFSETNKIQKIFKIDEHNFMRSGYIENALIQQYINVLEGGFRDRILNNYNYEDLNEVSLEINSSLTNIVSSLDTLIKFMGRSFRDNEGNAILTTINEKVTLSNRLSVNYNIEHLTNVPLIFATLMKEILNVVETQKIIESLDSFEEFNLEVSELLSNKTKLKKDNLFIFLELFDWAYFWIDYQKYYLTFFENKKLYIFWHWAYPFQATHLYSTIGCFDEGYFVRELFRLLIVLQATKPNEIEELICPIPEIRTYWDKYFNRVSAIVKELGALDSFSKMIKILRRQTYESLHRLDLNGLDPEFEASYREISNVGTDMISEYKRGSETYYKNFSDDIDGFINKINYELVQMEMEKSGRDDHNYEDRTGYFSLISKISYFNLLYVGKKFDYEIKLLRRDFTNGEPIEHFLETDNNWYIDPFGGFFINGVVDRASYYNLNNRMLHLIWHLSSIMKKDLFIKKIDF